MSEPQQAVNRSTARRLARAVVPAPARRLIRGLQYRAHVVRYKAYVIRTYRVLQRAPIEAIRYMAMGRELDNFTYEIANEDELARFLHESVGIPLADAARYIAELQGDSELRG